MIDRYVTQSSRFEAAASGRYIFNPDSAVEVAGVLLAGVQWRRYQSKTVDGELTRRNRIETYGVHLSLGASFEYKLIEELRLRFAMSVLNFPMTGARRELRRKTRTVTMRATATSRA